jgi:purine-binding chemotaxis protein CheW
MPKRLPLQEEGEQRRRRRLGSDPLSWILDTRKTPEEDGTYPSDIQENLDREEINEEEQRTEHEPAPATIPFSDEDQEEGAQDTIPVPQEALVEEEQHDHLTEQKVSPVEKARSQSGGKFLTFFLAGEEYGIEILRVVEVIELMDIISIPRMPPFIKGVINLRGKIIPIMDLRSRFGIQSLEPSEETVIILVQARAKAMGIIVDKVSEVVDIDERDIEDKPCFGVERNADCISGIGKSNGTVKLLLDIEEVVFP